MHFFNGDPVHVYLPFLCGGDGGGGGGRGCGGGGGGGCGGGGGGGCGGGGGGGGGVGAWHLLAQLASPLYWPPGSSTQAAPLQV